MTGDDVVQVDRDRQVLTIAGRDVDRYEALDVMRQLVDGMAELWPPLEPGWEKDKRRTVVGRSRDRRRT